MELEVEVRGVRCAQARSGSTRFVLEDVNGSECTTFREGIGGAAEALEGKRAVITHHEEECGPYRNVHLDSVTPAPTGFFRELVSEDLKEGDEGSAGSDER